jgi:predicted RNA binding protein YcfA (HicA-like mRNA interferase family)
MSTKRLTNLKPERVVRALQRLGWNVRRTTGSHVILGKPGNPARISIPFHKGKDVSPGLLWSELKAAGITLEDLESAL